MFDLFGKVGSATVRTHRPSSPSSCHPWTKRLAGPVSVQGSSTSGCVTFVFKSIKTCLAAEGRWKNCTAPGFPKRGGQQIPIQIPSKLGGAALSRHVGTCWDGTGSSRLLRPQSETESSWSSLSRGAQEGGDVDGFGWWTCSGGLDEPCMRLRWIYIYIYMDFEWSTVYMFV